MVIANDNPPVSLAHQLAFIHDELQWETKPEFADVLKFHLELSAVMAGEYYKLRIPIAAEGKIGSTWADVH
jgi:DNA polymerase I-like protein with 3'-5' exonuclease and polymerase domains